MRNFFCGWYFKCQNHRKTVAFIPAYHIRANVKTCSLQIITDEGAWNVDYPVNQFCMDDNCVKIGANLFSRQGSRTLTVRCVAEKAYPLAAPVKGEMGRRILESASCSCFYQFAENGKKVFEFVSDMASFEYEYPQ